jgi:nitrite reductase/ring-hydroxylating ferredoxin subunit
MTVETFENYEFACKVTDLPVRGKKTVVVGGVSILIVACESGLHAVEDRCPQTGRSLAHGQVLDCILTSPANGARYDLRTGRFVGGGLSPLQSHWLTVFPLQVIGDDVYVLMAHL